MSYHFLSFMFNHSQRLLPGYYLNVQQNPRTLLPKFYGKLQYWRLKTIEYLGLYCVKTRGKHIRIVVMNNLLPRDVKMHWKYDLKGWFRLFLYLSTTSLYYWIILLNPAHRFNAKTNSFPERAREKVANFQRSRFQEKSNFLLFLVFLAELWKLRLKIGSIFPRVLHLKMMYIMHCWRH